MPIVEKSLVTLIDGVVLWCVLRCYEDIDWIDRRIVHLKYIT